MKCPYCGEEMQTGYLQSARPVLWSPQKKKMMFLASEMEDVRITEGLWNGCFAVADYCELCEKVIVSTLE